MANLTIINLTMSQSLTQAQDKTLVLSEQLQALQAQAKSNIPTTEIPVIEKKKKLTK